MSPIHASGAGRCRRRENLVKMMEEKLEELEDDKENRQEAFMTPRQREHRDQNQVTDAPRDAKRERQQSRNRKIKNLRPKTRKATHRRTATC